MRLNKLCYYADFFISALLIALLCAITLTQANMHQVAVWAISICFGGVNWTFFEYCIHRWIYHAIPYFRELHHEHHANPKAHIGAPPVIGIVLIFLVGFAPFANGDYWIASGVTIGALSGYMAYMLVHHASHHWNTDEILFLHRLRQHHILHHYRSTEANFGIITPFWDYAFGTALEPTRRGSGSQPL